MTAGEIHWDAEAGDFDWARTSAIPRELTGRFPHEPLYVDLRWASSERRLGLSDPRFRARLTHQGVVTKVAFSPDGRWLATGSTDWTARMMEASTGREVARLAHDDGVTTVAFSPDGNWMATGSRKVAGGHGVVRLIETSAPGNEVVRLSHPDAANAVVFSPDGRWIAAGDGSGLRIMAAATGREVARCDHEGTVQAVAFSADGKRVTTGSDDSRARVIDAATGRELTSLAMEGSVRAVAFSPDGKWLAAASWPSGGHGSVRVMEAATGEEVAQLLTSTRVRQVRFEADSRYFELIADASSSNDLVLSRHPLRAEDLIEEACERAARNLTPAEWRQYVGADRTYRATCAAPGRPAQRARPHPQASSAESAPDH